MKCMLLAIIAAIKIGTSTASLLLLLLFLILQSEAFRLGHWGFFLFAVADEAGQGHEAFIDIRVVFDRGGDISK